MTRTNPDAAIGRLRKLQVGLHEGEAEEGFTLGTHRCVPPERTLEAIMPSLSDYGITRVARVTGLDRIGLEVFMVIRPNSYGLAVTQGKGFTREAAIASGVMEAIEYWHAERPQLPLRFATWEDLARNERVLDLAALPRVAPLPEPTSPLFWATGVDLLSSELVSLPIDLVHTCFLDDTKLRRSPFFVSSNGLASGNSVLEAVLHAVCELVERDAIIRFDRRDAADRDRRRVDLSSVTPVYLSGAIAKIEAAELSVVLWDMTSKWSVPSFICQIVDKAANPGPSGLGAGTHARRDVAAARAVAEAAQSRLTRISGARDDLDERLFGAALHTRTLWINEQARGNGENKGIAFDDCLDLTGPSLQAEYSKVIQALKAAGLLQLAAIELATSKVYSVVRVVAPGLLGSAAQAQ